MGKLLFLLVALQSGSAVSLDAQTTGAATAQLPVQREQQPTRKWPVIPDIPLPEFQEPSCPQCLPQPVKDGTPSKWGEWGEFLARQLQTCTETAVLLQTQVPLFPACFLNGACEGVPAESVKAYPTYLGACTKRAIDLSALPATKFSNRDELKRTAVLARRGEEIPFCGALLIDATTAVTLYHCVKALKVDEIVLRVWEEPAREIAFRLSDRPTPTEMAYLDDRPVVLELADAVKEPASRLCLGDPAAKEPLASFGYLRDGIQSVNPRWSNSIRTDTFVCRVQSLVSDVDPFCFAHNCQSYPGFSGTPLFAAAPSGSECDVRVVGLQMQGTGPISSGCSGPNLNQAFPAAALLRGVLPRNP